MSACPWFSVAIEYGASRQTLRRRLDDGHEGLKTRGPECFLGDEFGAYIAGWIEKPSGV